MPNFHAFLQCFDTVGWVTERTWPLKILKPAIPDGSSLKDYGEPRPNLE